MQKHLQRLLLIAAMLLVPWVTQAQTLDEYSFSTGTDTSKWIAVPTTLTSLITPGAGDYGVSSVHNLGFSFPFGEDSYTQFSVNSDGNLKFGSSVTGTSNYSTPFSSSNASVNNPKINFFGCDGYCDNSHYVRYLHTADTNGDSLGVVEFCMGTFTSTTRSYLYKWQVHLYHNGKIEVVYGVAPSTAPAVTRQQGLCINASDGWLVNASNAASHFTAGSSTTIASGIWPSEGRYYTFERPNLACPKPVQLILTSLGTTEASFVWVDTTGSGSWLVRLDSTDMGTPTEVYDTSIYITDLSANTEYTFNVANLCPSGDTSSWRSITFRTPCTFLDSLPFFYGFEDAATGTTAAFPNCWNRLNNGSSYNYYPYVGSSSSYNHTPGGSKGLYWYNTTTTGTYGDYEVVVLPGVDTNVYPIRTLQMRFWAAPSSTGYSPILYVGVMTNPSDITTFQYLDTIQVSGNTSWQEYESMLGAYRGDGTFVAIRSNRASWTLYVDDITLEEMPACPRTSELTQTDATLNSVTINWTEMGEATQWVLQYDTVDFVPGTPAGTTEYPTFMPYTISGLDSAQSYYIYLHADCGGDTSVNRFILASTLASSPASLPFYCNFECEGNCGWELLNGNQTNAWYVGTAVNNGGNKSLYISNNNGASNAYSTGNISYAYAYRTIDFADSGEFAYSYDWRSQGESHNYDFTRVFLAPAGYQWPVNDNPAGSTYNFASWSCPAGWIELTEQFGSPANLAQSSSWRTVTGTFQLQSPGIYNLVFAWANDGSGGTQPPTAIDNVSIIHNTCPAPVLHGINVGVSTADISWDETGDASLWYFECDTVVINPGDGMAQFSLSLNDTSVSLTGLDSGTMYYYYIWSLCDAGDSSLALSGSFTTLVGAPATAPYFCDFEHAGNNGWTLDNGSQTNKWYVGNTVNHGGSRSMYVSDNNGVTHSYSGSESYVFASRTFDLTDTGEYSYSFDWLCNGESSYDFIRVALVPVSVTLTPGNYSGFDNSSAMPSGSIALDGSYRMNLQTNWQTRTGTFYLHNPGTYNWVFLWRNDGSVYNQPPAAIDNVALSRNTCPAPQNLTCTHVTGDSIVITWAPGGDETEWAVSTDSTTVYVYDTTYAFDELNANTSYSISVRAICGDGDTSLPASISVRTTCGAITVLPYFEDFESYPDGASSYAPPECGIPCWSRLDNASQYHFGYIGSRSSWPSGGHSGTGFLYYYMPTTTGTYADWIISVLPPIDSTVHPLNTLQMSFWVKMNSSTTSGDIVIGAMTNPTVASTFTPIDTVHVAGDIYQMKESYFSHYTGPGEYIALKYTRNASTTTYYFVDDIVVEPIPDCPPVSGIALAGLDSNFLTVTWTENGTATSWNIEYGPHGFTPGTGTTDVATAVPFTITGLTPATEYDIYITPSCLTGISATRMGSFRTANSYIGLPFSCDFENIAQNAQWALENGTNTNKWAIGTATNNGGTHAMYISNDNGTSNSYTISSSTVDYAYMDLMIPAPGDYGYSFDWKCHGESTLDYLRVALIPNSVTLTAGTALPTGLNATSMPASWISLDGNSKLNLNGSWQTRSDVINIPSAGVYHLAFIFRCDGSVGTMPPPAVDNIVLVQSPCSRPDSVTINNLTQTTADFTWSEMGTATEWQYQLDNGTITTVYTTNAALTGLSANTAYNFKVRSICGGGDTSFWRFYSFRTPCSYITIPYTQDFESETSSSSTTGSAFVNCWIRLNNGTSYGGYPYVGSSSTYNHTPSGSKGLYWYNTTTTGTYGDYEFAVLPPFDSTISANSLQLSFWAKASSASYTPVFKIGVMTDPNNPSTFVGVDTITISGTSWQLVEVPLSTYTGNGQFVAVKADRPTSVWTAYVDDFTLDYVPTCIAPRNIFATATSTNSITLDWVDITPAMEWQIEYGLQGFTRGSSAGTMISAYAHPVVITGLDTLTSYDFYIRPICAVGDSSRWPYPTTLSTAMCENVTTVENWTATSSSTTTNYGPIGYSCYNYSYTQTIIDSAQMASVGGDITAFGFKPINSASSYGSYYTGMDIYMANISESVFTNNFIHPDANHQFVQVMSNGTCNFTNDNWQIISLDTAFTWDGHSNVLFAVNRSHGSYSCSAEFAGHISSGNKMVYAYNDDDPYNINTAYYDEIENYVGDIILYSCSAPGCPQPVITSVTKDYHSATVSWTGSGTNYEVNIKESAAANWPATDIAVTGNSYTFNGLMPSTNYMIRVRQDCTADSLDYSEWTIIGVLTDSLPCLTPDSLHATAVTNATATFDWNVNGNENVWDIHVWYGSYDSIYRVATRPATVGGFTAGLTYNAAIRPVCGINLLEGDWSDTVQFTTAVCPDVTGLTTSNVTTNSVTLNWNNNPMAQGWNIEYGPSGFTQGQGTQATSTTNSYVVSGLMDDFTYDFYVKAVCGDNWTSENWVGTSATTQEGTVPCDAPTGVSTTVADNSVTVNWTAETGNISFEIEYGVHGFNHGTGTTVNATSSPAVISNLEYETQYDLYVRALCEQNVTSPWSPIATFTTGQRPSEDCDPVQNLTIDNVTETSAAISWQAGATGDSWQVVLTDANGATVSDNVTSETHADLNGLSPRTNYTVKVRTVCGDDNYSAYVTANFRTGGEGIDDVNGISCRIFPNPATSSTTVSVSGVNGKVRIAVVDMNGRTVATETLECSADCEKTMEVDKLAQGAYFVRITADNANMVRKLIVR